MLPTTTKSCSIRTCYPLPLRSVLYWLAMENIVYRDNFSPTIAFPLSHSLECTFLIWQIDVTSWHIKQWVNLHCILLCMAINTTMNIEYCSIPNIYGHVRSLLAINLCAGCSLAFWQLHELQLSHTKLLHSTCILSLKLRVCDMTSS